MTALELFQSLAPILAPTLEREFERRDLCILSTRIAIDIADYFGIKAQPVPVRVVIYNKQFAAHVLRGELNVADFTSDGSWSVGVGFGHPAGGKGGVRGNKWDGHLITVADGAFGDFSIQNAERPEKNIITGPACVGAHRASAFRWRGWNEHGTVIEYERTAETIWQNSPDWKDPQRRRRIVGELIRHVKGVRYVG
jgi:hypothetical protein